MQNNIRDLAKIRNNRKCEIELNMHERVNKKCKEGGAAVSMGCKK